MNFDVRCNIVELHLFLHFPLHRKSDLLMQFCSSRAITRNVIFHHPQIFMSEFADPLLHPATSSAAPVSPPASHPPPTPPQLSPVTLKVRGAKERNTCEGEGGGGDEGGEGGGAYFRTQERLACCFWVTGDGTPAWCIRTTHTETHTYSKCRQRHMRLNKVLTPAPSCRHFI